MQKILKRNSHLERKVYTDKTDLLNAQAGRLKREKADFHGVSFKLFAGRWFRYVGGVILVIGLACTSVLLSINQGAEVLSDDLVLPAPQNIIDTQLLQYSSPDAGAQGSGDINLSELPVVRTVHTKPYEVRPGDTLSEIAALYDIDVGTLISFNKIENVRRLMAGTTIMVPDLDGVPYTVKIGDSLDIIASKYEVSLESILDANDLQTALIQPGQKLFIPGASISEYDYRKAMGTLFIYPIYGRLTSGYGYRSDPFTGVRRMHYGVDLSGRIGTPIKASMEGTVAAIGNQPNGYGKYVVLKHRQGYQTLYGHMSAVSVRLNQRIYQGQKIGELGNTGRSTGPHLHFSLYKNNVPINPLGGYLYK